MSRTKKNKPLKTKVTDFLKATPGKRYSARQIARAIFQQHPDEYAKKRARFDTEALFLNQLVAEISSQRREIVKSGDVSTTEGKRPRQYYYLTPEDKAGEGLETEATSSPENDRKSPLEKELYPLLAQYLRVQLNVYSKRIDEKRSKNRRGPRGNRWLFPDLVAMEPLDQEWHADVVACVSSAGDNRVKLWSFEVKQELTGSNVRESYFQAVSNSSWANYGYLVAADIIGESTRKELELLSSLHGIGVIHLDVEEPDESQILILAREKPNVDWQSANRILKENTDFLNYIKSVKGYYKTNDLRPADWEFVT